jgi:hypothetical protein
VSGFGGDEYREHHDRFMTRAQEEALEHVGDVLTNEFFLSHLQLQSCAGSEDTQGAKPLPRNSQIAYSKSKSSSGA